MTDLVIRIGKRTPGLSLKPDLWPDLTDGIRIVRLIDDAPSVQLVWRLAEMAGRQIGCGTCWPSPKDRDAWAMSWRLVEPIAAVAVKDRTAVGVITTYRSTCYGTWTIGQPGCVATHHRADPVRAVLLVWVFWPHQRQGIGAALVEAVANYCGLMVQDLARTPPFTPSGWALAKRSLQDGQLILSYPHTGEMQLTRGTFDLV